MQLSYLIILVCSIFMGVNASVFATSECLGNYEICTRDEDYCSGCCVDYVGGLEGDVHMAIDDYDLYRNVWLAEGW
ncbi:hypothetical protein BDR03DRAFT_967178 [Suillus americanus]|nr:hypothetical protein BDR03DRAFT_967178 [Suillus americanus]